MKKLLLSFIIIITFSSCWLFYEKTSQSFEYNPEKAGARITGKVTVPNGKYGSYIDCSDNHLYLVNTNSVSIIDLTNDRTGYNINVTKTIPFDIHLLYPDTTTDKFKIGTIRGIADFGDSFILCLYIAKMNYDEKGEYISNSVVNNNMFSLDYNGNLEVYDMFIDVTDDSIVNIHYNNKEKNLYITNKEGSDKITLSEYINNNCIEKKDKYTMRFIMEAKYFYYFYQSDISLFCICYNFFAELDTVNKLYIFSSYQTTTYREVDLTYLGLHYKPLSVFYYKDHCWLYVRTDVLIDGKHASQYELWQLELL